jgi:cell division protein FtsQ
MQAPRPAETGPSSGPIPVPEADGPRLIVIGGEDELPDATYAVQTGRTPEDPKGPRVHPRLKARRVAIRQAAGRRRIWWSAVIGVLLAAVILVMVVLASPLFAINHVEITGAVYTDPSEIAAAVKPVRGKPIPTADLNGVRKRLEKLPWVKYAAIQMRFPHTIAVQIAERVPVASYYATDNKWRAIDIDGRVIAILDGQPVDYPAILGPGPLAVPGDIEADYGRVAQLIIALPPKLRPMVKVFEMDQSGNVSMTLQLNDKGDTLVDLCSAAALDVRQLVTLTAFINTNVDPRKAPPGRITACKPDLVTTSDT